MRNKQSNILLFFLLALFASNQWSRYSLAYLGHIAPPKACRDSCTILPIEANSTKELLLPLCSRFDCQNDQKCLDCKFCLDSHDYGKNSLSYSTCLSNYEYGILSSYGYTLSFALFTLVSSQIAAFRTKSTKKFTIVLAGLGWGVTTALQGLAANYKQLFLVRLLLGCFEAFSTPLSLSLIADVFPAVVLGEKNGIHSFGVYIGGALASSSIILANSFGYKQTCYIIGGFSVFSAVGLFCVDTRLIDPSRYDKDIESRQLSSLLAEENDTYSSLGITPNTISSRDDDVSTSRLANFRQDTTESSLNDSILTREREKMLSFWSDSSLWFLFLAAGLRLFGGFAIAAYLPVFFERRFPAENTIYSIINGILVLVCGSLSAYGGGRISDKLSAKRDQRFKAYVPAIGSLAGFVPFLLMLFTSRFYLAMFFFGIEILLAESWMGPSIAVLQQRAELGDSAYSKEQVLSFYMFFGTIVGSLSPLVIGSLDDGTGYRVIQSSLFMAVGVSYIGSSLFFFLLGNKIRTKKYELL